MAVTIYMPDGTVKVLGKQSPTTGTAKKLLVRLLSSGNRHRALAPGF
jgi:hypothetical protein